MGVTSRVMPRLSFGALLCMSLAACNEGLQSQLASSANPMLQAMCERQFAAGQRGRPSPANQQLCAQFSVGAATFGATLVGGVIAQVLSPRERGQAGETTQRVLDAPPRPGTRETWTSPETPGNRGGSELVRVDEGGNCRMVREIAYVRGQEVSQQSRFCRTASGSWERVA